MTNLSKDFESGLVTGSGIMGLASLVLMAILLVASRPEPQDTSFFGLKLESEITENETYDVKCALVSGLVPDEIVCACFDDVKNFPINTYNAEGRVVVHSWDGMCEDPGFEEPHRDSSNEIIL